MPYKDPALRRIKHREYSRQHYLRNQAALQQKTRVKKAALTAWWREFKSLFGCISCDESDPSCIDFHHVITDEKADRNDSAASWIRNTRTPAAIVDEIERTCVPMCSNCHRKVHAMARKK